LQHKAGQGAVFPQCAIVGSISKQKQKQKKKKERKKERNENLERITSYHPQNSIISIQSGFFFRFIHA
jgi:hypothetical protein